MQKKDVYDEREMKFFITFIFFPFLLVCRYTKKIEIIKKMKKILMSVHWLLFSVRTHLFCIYMLYMIFWKFKEDIIWSPTFLLFCQFLLETVHNLSFIQLCCNQHRSFITDSTREEKKREDWKGANRKKEKFRE